MDKYINREAARPDAFCIGVSCQDCPFLKSPLYGGCRIDDFIASLPAADVAPVRHGRYIIDDMGDASCSECGAKWLDVMQNFCPNCGARMEES